MADYERVVEFLRDFRTSPVQTVTDEVREAAVEYARLCAVANDRLRQCAVLLQRGLRAEAINLADASPNLLDLVAALDLPDPEGWAEFCQRSDLPVPPQLQIDRASQLNDAYGQDQPLELLFTRHRRLALSHAPVGKRLEVMRQIAQMDASPFWEKDIRTFEYARIKELRVNFSHAVQQKDVKTITALAAEVLESPWLEQPPQDLQTAARDVHDRLKLAQFTTTLSELVARLRSAFAGKSLKECATLLNQAKELIAAHGRAEVPVEAAAEIRTVSEWVAQENQIRAARDAFAAACDGLRRALNADVKDAELDTAYRAAASHEEPVPPELQERYDATVRRRANATRRNFVLALTGLAVVGVILVGVVYSVSQSHAARDWGMKIHQPVVDRNLELAKQTVHEQETAAPKFNSAAPVIAAKQEVANLQEEFDRDFKLLRDTLINLNQAAERGVAATKGDAGQTNLDDLRSAQAAVEDALGRRKELPDLRWVDGQNRLGKLTSQVEGLRDDLKWRTTQGIIAKADAVAQRADSVPVEPAAKTLAAGETALASMQQELAPLRPFAEKGSTAESKLDDADKRISAKREALRKARVEVDARHALVAAAGSSSTLRQALLDYAQRFPDSPSSRDFARAAQETELAASVEAFYVMSGAWAGSPVPAGEKAATQRLDQVKAFLHDYPTSPMAGRASAYADYLQEAAEATSVQNPWQQALGETLAAPMVAELKFLRASDGTVYYILGDPNLRMQHLNERVNYAFDALDPQNLARRKTVTVNPPRKLETEKPQLMPHAIFAQTLSEQLKTVDRTNWDTWGIDLVSRIANEDKIDDVVKGLMLRDALQATMRVDAWGLGDIYDKTMNDLVRQRLENTIWYDPDKPVPEVTHASLKRIFASVPKAADVKQALIARRLELFRSLRPVFGGSGVLLRDDSGHLEVQSPSPILSGSAGWAVVPPAGWTPGVASGDASSSTTASTATSQATSQPAAPASTGLAAAAAAAGASNVTPAKFVRIAQWKDNKLTVEDAAVRDLPEGTMVLITRP